MKRSILIAVSAALIALTVSNLPGCVSGKRTTYVENTNPAPMIEGQKGKDETIGDAAGQIAKANETNPNPESRATIAEQVRRIMTALQGASWKAVEVTVAKLVEERNAAQADAGRLNDRIATLERDLEKAKSDAQRAAFLGVVRVFAVIGGALTLGGVLIALWSTYKRAGIILACAGPVIGGSGLLWGKWWFTLSVGAGVLLVGAAVGIRYVFGVLDADKNGKIDILEKKPATS